MSDRKRIPEESRIVKCSNPACNGEIRNGERYVAFDRHIERVSRSLRYPRGAVTVEDAELVAAYHLGCAPSTGG